MIDEIAVFKVEIDLASKTPKQDDEEEEYIPDATTSPNPTMQSLLAMFPQCRHENDEQYRRRIDDIKFQVQPFVTDPTLFFTQFYQRNQVHMVNQVFPSGNSKNVKAQGENSDVQRVIRMLTVQETPQTKLTLQVPFSKNFSKTVKDLKSSTTCCTDSFSTT